MSTLLPSAPAPDLLLASHATPSSIRTRAATTTSAVPAAATPAPSVPRTTSHTRSVSGSRRESLPFVFRPPLHSNTSSTSLVPSTAEGRPIPLDNSTAAHRTSALRELNRSQPSSRHRYTRSAGAPPSVNSTTTGTYSQPVLVRTYSGPPPSSSSSRPASRRAPLSSISITSSVTNWRPGRAGAVVNMARSVKGKSRPLKPSKAGLDDAKLPPLEAFTFKSIMTEMQQDIGADLDRIAEICARSRYSLSNQYEVHVAPHGSGTSFAASETRSSQQRGSNAGPTLQAITSDDEQSSSTRHRRRKGTQRRRSAAYGTLETIMSSSRSSDEDRSKKKPAAELAEEVRGRAGTQDSNSSGSAQDGSGATNLSSEEQAQAQRRSMRRKSSSFAAVVMDNTRTSQGALDATSPRSSGTALISEPARPETSRNHLEIRTSAEDTAGMVAFGSTESQQQQQQQQRAAHETTPAQPSRAVVSASMASAAISTPDRPGEPSARSSLFSGLSSWIPWRAGAGTNANPVRAVTEVATTDPKSGHRSSGQSKSYAEGTLRELLKTAESSTLPVPGGSSGTADHKGKGVEHVL
ncbi:uncharacterized protein B0I36DRAFT_320022 [Microdochium trichocladiopsis]|uniref:Uncharacterized protein n=1 Tax=Microdochium trichocladiopsis TaxID=1682393 RepID=A0A9P8Y7X9_9PEZI|nr:uncharacterized protein B0I36DRAFT_320022 [Microdochium trichocladiopsis]KAH7032777.1 hypothetical protein B0I36DRAFT_320022 [Microdochium trichocladiopsis]